MSKYYLINRVALMSNGSLLQLQPGDLIDDVVRDVPAIQNAGGLVWPSSDPTVKAAATRALQVRGKGGNASDLIMLTAACNSLQANSFQAAALAQADWFVNALTGIDTNDGSSAAPLKTIAELNRRLGAGARIYPPVNVNAISRLWTLHIGSDLPTTDPLTLDLSPRQGVSVLIQGGVKSIDATGTFTAITASVKTLGSNARLLGTDSALSINAFWTGQLGKRVRITSGARVNAVFWVDKDLGTKQAAFSNPTQITAMIMANPYDFSDISMTSVVPAVSDPYQVETLFSVTLGKLRIVPEGNDDYNVTGAPVVVIGELNCNTRGEYVGVHFSDIKTQLSTYSCSFSRVDSDAQAWYSCNDCIPGDALQGGHLIVNSGYMHKGAGLVSAGVSTLCWVSVQPGAVAVFDYDSQVSKGQVQIAGQARIGSLSIWDTISNGITPGGHALVIGSRVDSGNDPTCSGAGASVGAYGYDGVTRLWGAGAAGTGVSIGAGCTLTIKAGTVPTLTGASDFRLAAASTGRAWIESSGAWSGAGTATAINCTWTLMGTALGSSGFGGGTVGGNAQNVASRAAIVAQ